MTGAARQMKTETDLHRGSFDVARVRADFPILFREIHDQPLVYLDNGASAQKPSQVLEAMEHAYRFEYANVHRGLHYLSNIATTRMEEARETARSFLNASSIKEIIFTRNATDAINLVASSFGGMILKSGDEVVLSILEHHSNIVPWHFHRERRGVALKWAPITDTGEFPVEAFKRLLNSKTKLVAITHMSNFLGTILPIKEIVQIAHSRGIPVLVDGSQAAVHLTVDVRELDCDFYVCTGHKLYGPSGIGLLYAKEEHLNSMPPYQGGGEMIEAVHTDNVTYTTPPHKFEAGTPAIVETVGLGAALNYIMQVGRPLIMAHEKALCDYAHARFAEFPWLTVYGKAKNKGSIISFNVEGLHPHDVSTIIDRSGVAIRAGHHCAQPLMDRLGVTATCRASFAMYNTKEEIDVLIQSLQKARELFA
ncbi:MAG: cysteine desulfurase [Hyphomicrobium sp.]